MSELVSRLRYQAVQTTVVKQDSNTPEWLSDASIEAFMASVDAPAVALV